MPRHPTCRDPSPQTSYSGRPGTASTTHFPLGHSVVYSVIFLLIRIESGRTIIYGHYLGILVAIGKKVFICM